MRIIEHRYGKSIFELLSRNSLRRLYWLRNVPELSSKNNVMRRIFSWLGLSINPLNNDSEKK
jgi:hypothetical protein